MIINRSHLKNIDFRCRYFKIAIAMTNKTTHYINNYIVISNYRNLHNEDNDC